MVLINLSTHMEKKPSNSNVRQEFEDTKGVIEIRNINEKKLSLSPNCILVCKFVSVVITNIDI